MKAKVVSALREGYETFTAPLLKMKEARDNAACQQQHEPVEQLIPAELSSERGASDVETLGKMTIATGALLVAGGMAMELAGVERTLNLPLGLGVGGLVVGATIYGAEKLIQR